MEYEVERPLVLVSDPTFEVDKILEHAKVLQFPPPAHGQHFNVKQVRRWVEEHIPQAAVLYLRGPLRVDAQLLDRASRLKAVVTISAGHDNIDTAECAKRGIRIGFAGSCLTEATAELCVGLLLAVSRRIPEAVEVAKRGKWPPNWHPTFMRGKALEGAVVGIFGMGRIGRSVAEKLAAFRPREFIYHNRRTKVELPELANSYRYVTFEELLRESDFLVISASASADSNERFGWREFRLMNSDAILINVSRGSVVRTEDLAKALEEGEIGGAGLDVTAPEPLPPGHVLFSLPNCVITPHIGSANEAARARMLALGQANVIAALRDERMPSELEMEMA